MYFRVLLPSSFLLAASALAAAEPAPYKLGAMPKNQLFGVLKRQQGTQTYGYQPTQTPCGPGDTCAVACGAGSQQCASNDGDTHCYYPLKGDTCCPDLSGNSCDSGYYCTSDSVGGTWCCPNGMSLVNCAAAYSLTNSLVSETPTTSPSSVAAASSTSASVIPTTSASIPGTTSTTPLPLSSVPSSTVAAPTTGSNATVATFTPSASQSSVFKGAANELAAYRGLPALVLALGFVGVVAVL